MPELISARGRSASTLKNFSLSLIVCLPFLASAFPREISAETGPKEVVFFKNAPASRPLIVWGGTSRAVIVSSGSNAESRVIELHLDTPGAYSGMILQLPKPVDIAKKTGRMFLVFRIRGASGGERLGVSLIDSFKGGSDYDLNAGVGLERYVSVLTDWQTVRIPLSDFPVAGVNWVRPPTDKLPHTGPFDWKNLESVMFIIQGKPLIVWLADIVIAEAGTSSARPALASPFSANPMNPDFANGGAANFTAGFNGTVNWEVRISSPESGAVKIFRGTSAKVSVDWNGDADEKTGGFRPGKCVAVLSAAGPGDDRMKKISRLEVFLKSVHCGQVKVNQAGYLPGETKQAYVSGPSIKGRNFVLKDRVTGEIMYRSVVDNSPAADEPSRETVTAVDFSGFERTGTYRLEIDGLGSSFPFTIGGDVYRKIYSDSIRAFYYQRCGMDLTPEFAGRWTHKACHLDDAVVHPSAVSPGVAAGMKIRSIGGWHDAGDLGKKVVPAATSLAHLLSLYEMFPEKVGDIKLGVPNATAGQPDLLAEARYELEWMLTMQRKDGAVYHLVTSPDFAGPGVMPEDDRQTRYFTQASSCATADFCAIMAVAARIYSKFDPAFGSKCLVAAGKAWLYLGSNPDIFPPGGYLYPPGIHGTGAYGDKSDREERFWAACELFRTTGREDCDRYVLEHAGSWPRIADYPPGWTDPHVWGMLSYLFCGRSEADKDLQERIRTGFLAYAESILVKIRKNGYPAALSEDQYYWGSNSVIMGFACDLIVAYALSARKEFRDAALSQLNAVLGCNTLDLSFVTGTGIRSVRDPWQAASAWDGIDEPVPGFLPGGPDKYLDDPLVADARKRLGLAPAACFVDSHNAYSCNEVCLPYNSPLVFAAGYFAK